MSDEALVLKILEDFHYSSDYPEHRDAWMWASCFKLYQNVNPGNSEAIDPMLDIVKDVTLSVITRLAALAVLSKIGGKEVVQKTTELLFSPDKTFSEDKSIRNAMLNISEGKEIRLSSRNEILTNLEVDVKSVADWLDRLEVLRTLELGKVPDLTLFLREQKELLKSRIIRS